MVIVNEIYYRAPQYKALGFTNLDQIFPYLLPQQLSCGTLVTLVTGDHIGHKWWSVIARFNWFADETEKERNGLLDQRSSFAGAGKNDGSSLGEKGKYNVICN